MRKKEDFFLLPGSNSIATRLSRDFNAVIITKLIWHLVEKWNFGNVPTLITRLKCNMHETKASSIGRSAEMARYQSSQNYFDKVSQMQKYSIIKSL